MTGILLIWLLRIDVFDTWLVAGIALYPFMLAFAITVYAPAFRKQLTIAGSLADDAGDDEATPEYQAASARSKRLGLAIVVVVIGIVTLMVSKPALW